MKKITLVCILTLALLPLVGQSIDLTSSNWYFRKGFSSVWLRTVPSYTDENWSVIRSPSKKRTLLVRDLDIPQVRSSSRWNPLPGEPVTVCAIIPFSVSKGFLDLTDPALLLAYIGQSWSVYLNGFPVYSGQIKDGNGHYVEHTTRNALIPLDSSLLKEGLNLLAIQLTGDPGSERMGLLLKSPYVIDSYRVLVKRNREYVDLVLISVYAIFALYNIVLFLLRPKERSYLLFGLATLTLSAYLFSKTMLAMQLINNTGISNRMEIASLFCVVPLFFAFFDLLLKNRISRLTIILSIAYLGLLVPAMLLRTEPFLLLWQYTTPVFIVYFLVFILGKVIVADAKEIFRGVRHEGLRGMALAWHRFSIENDTGKIMLGTILFVSAAIFDTARALNGQDLILVKYSFVFFILGVAAMQSGRMLKIYASLEGLNASLEHTVIERTSALSGAVAEQRRLNSKMLESNRELQASIEESQRDLSMAISVQKGFFPAIAPTVRGWDIAMVFETATGVSGDLYDFYTKGDEFNGVLVGDVSGTGIASGLITVLARSIFFRKLKDPEITGLADKVFAINKELVRELSSVGNSFRCSLLWVDGNRVEYVNASHPDVLLRHAGKSEALPLLPKDVPGFKLPPFGRNQLDDAVVPLRFTVSEGDGILAYTDALVDSRNAKGEAYGIERLRHSFRRADMETAQTILSSIMIDYRGFIGRMTKQDDLTVVALKKK